MERTARKKITVKIPRNGDLLFHHGFITGSIFPKLDQEKWGNKGRRK